MAPAAEVGLRPVRAEDRDFLLALYASTRAGEFQAVGWDAATLAAFLEMQFQIQDRALHQAHPGASFDVVLVDDQSAGRLYVDRQGDAVHVIDVALLPEHRGQGIGAALLGALIAEARASGRPVRLQALRGSPAIRLYERLGFEVVGQDEVYVSLEIS